MKRIYWCACAAGMVIAGSAIILRDVVSFVWQAEGKTHANQSET